MRVVDGKTPFDVLRPNLQSLVLLKQLKQKLYTDKGCRRGPPLNPEENVFARNFRQGMPWVPARVVGATSQSSAQVYLEDGTPWHRHGDHLRFRPTDAPTAATAVTETCQPVGAAVQLEPQGLNESESAGAPGALSKPGETSVGASDSVASTGVTPHPTGISPPQLHRSTRTRRAVQRATADELWRIVLEKWEKLRNERDFVSALFSSLPSRMRAVVDAQGEMT
ncbi:uncharacterized protein ISCGN_024068 [Ixodes scapularis]